MGASEKNRNAKKGKYSRRVLSLVGPALDRVVDQLKRQGIESPTNRDVEEAIYAAVQTADWESDLLTKEKTMTSSDYPNWGIFRFKDGDKTFRWENGKKVYLSDEEVAEEAKVAAEKAKAKKEANRLAGLCDGCGEKLVFHEWERKCIYCGAYYPENQ